MFLVLKKFCVSCTKLDTFLGKKKQKLKCFIIFYQACPNSPHTANNVFQRDQVAFVIEGGALLSLAWI